MIKTIHMHIGGFFGKELGRACFTLVFWTPMTCIIHVLVSGMLVDEDAIAGLAVIGWGSVIERIHVLIHCVWAIEFTRASVAFEFHVKHVR